MSGREFYHAVSIAYHELYCPFM